MMFRGHRAPRVQETEGVQHKAGGLGLGLGRRCLAEVERDAHATVLCMPPACLPDVV
jgi:hypothetical protein